jgi:tetratricopeptide (TPR) repeat protein
MAPLTGTTRTDRVLPAVGWICAVGLLVSVVTAICLLVANSSTIPMVATLFAMVVFVGVPEVIFRLHVAASSDLTNAEKRDWERHLIWGLDGFIVPFFYLIRSDRSLRKWHRVNRRIIAWLVFALVGGYACSSEWGALQINRAADLYKKGRYAEALAVYDGSVRANPSFGWAHLGRANCLDAMGRTADAVAAYREAVRLMPAESEAQYWLGATLYKDGQAAEALEPLRESIRLRPSDWRAHVTLGMALSVSGMHTEALIAFRDGRSRCGECALWAEAEERFRISNKAAGEPTKVPPGAHSQ